ncbi:MAG TPA: hypothetical protein VHE81_02355, partial [Lacipirellulaceae bacterium]|nr:hypothetical protein [Lacipirellulaceae bacterium]
MYLSRIQALLEFIFQRYWKRARCPARARAYVRCLLALGIVLYARTATATVVATGDYSPADNPFTPA